MKLRNKKTGEIGQPRIGCKGNYIEICVDTKNHITHYYKTMRGVFKEWKVIKEQKKYWYISDDGEVYGLSDYYVGSEIEDAHREIGNLFEIKEDAEQAVEKLKAWKRLKDNGISFEVKVIDGRWYLGPKVEPKPRTFDGVNDLFKDVMFVFGVNDESNQ